MFYVFLFIFVLDYLVRFMFVWRIYLILELIGLNIGLDL